MELHRNIFEYLKLWKESESRKPLLLKGARQIGKTWIMEEFGRQCYDYWVKFDFDRDRELHSIFQNSKDYQRIFKELSLYTDVPIIPGRTLIIFDEIQECEDAFNSLKYIYDDAPQYHIIAAGSLLGVAVKKKRMTVPVGKVTVKKMYPLSFKEFLMAADMKVYEYVESLTDLAHLPEIIYNKLNLEYKRYLICGGMPAAVMALLENRGMAAVDTELQDILDLYELDFAKYADPREIPRIRAVWHSLPYQLSKENRKFIYNVIKSGARSKDYEDALLWLKDAGMIHQVLNITKPGMPLSAYKDPDAFKVYACDVGLLRRLSRTSAEVILNGNSGFTEFKGAMAENAVLVSLCSEYEDELIYYWTSGNKAEVEFILQEAEEIIPIEVKAEGNINGKSLSVYDKKYSPTHRVRFSALNLQYNGNLISSPSALASWLRALLNLCSPA